ncbi:MAG: hypothetical protein ACI4LM_06970 [Anaerovoracaceae bacterium]
MERLPRLIARKFGRKKQPGPEAGVIKERPVTVKRMVLIMTAVIALVSALILFRPDCLGVSGDGSEVRTMEQVGLEYPNGEKSGSGYFVRQYSRNNRSANYSIAQRSSHQMLIQAAMDIDDAVTHNDGMFDIRFLGLLYWILFLPALYILICQVCRQIGVLSELAVMGITGILIFSDTAYITYFNSLYPEPLCFICMMYMAGAFLSFQTARDDLREYGSMALFFAAAAVLVTARKSYAILGIVVIAGFFKIALLNRKRGWKTACAVLAVLIGMLSVNAYSNIPSEFTQESKFHAMTTGVMAETSKPQKTLASFGIEPSFEVLTGVTAYGDYPEVDISDETIRRDFLDKYDTADIAKYYAVHPGDYLKLYDQAIKSCFAIRRSGCGSFQKSAGMKKGAQSAVWSLWSFFKRNFAPDTVGTFVILLALIIISFRKEYGYLPGRSDVSRKNTVWMDILLGLSIAAIIQGTTAICMSGSTGLTEHCFLISAGMDLSGYLLFAELMHRLNIL